MACSNITKNNWDLKRERVKFQERGKQKEWSLRKWGCGIRARKREAALEERKDMQEPPWGVFCVAVCDRAWNSHWRGSFAALCLAHWGLTMSTGNKFALSVFWIKGGITSDLNNTGKSLKHRITPGLYKHSARLRNNWLLHSPVLPSPVKDSSWGPGRQSGTCHYSMQATRQPPKVPWDSFPENLPLVLISGCCHQGWQDYNLIKITHRKIQMTIQLPGYLQMTRDHLNLMNP
jgi:hypothetical protein